MYRKSKIKFITKRPHENYTDNDENEEGTWDSPEKEELLTIWRREWEQVSEPEEWDLEKRRVGDTWMWSEPPERLRAIPSEPESVRRPWKSEENETRK